MNRHCANPQKQPREDLERGQSETKHHRYFRILIGLTRPLTALHWLRGLPGLAFNKQPGIVNRPEAKVDAMNKKNHVSNDTKGLSLIQKRPINSSSFTSYEKKLIEEHRIPMLPISLVERFRNKDTMDSIQRLIGKI
jgi:hypothetical protein